jgi:hypothetical protein
MKKGGCLYLCHFVFNVFLQNELCRCEMSAREDGELEEGVLAVFNGMKFKFNDLVDVIVGTGLGVRGNKREPFKGHFKGVCGTVRGGELREVEFCTVATVQTQFSRRRYCQQPPALYAIQ